MTDAQINETLAKAVGFDFGWNHKSSKGMWYDPTGKILKKLPNFLNDFNTCLKWIVPALERQKLYWKVGNTSFKDGNKPYVVTIAKSCHSIREEDVLCFEYSDHPARAFCMAALKYFEEKGK